MMDTPEVADKRHTLSWIASLAITVACCATQFVVFAGYIFDLKETIAATQLRSTLLEQRVSSMTMEIDNMHRHVYGQATPPASTGAAIQLPVPLTPEKQPGLAVAPASTPVSSAAPNPVPADTTPAAPISTTTHPSSMIGTPPAAAPGSAPTVPAEVPNAAPVVPSSPATAPAPAKH